MVSQARKIVIVIAHGPDATHLVVLLYSSRKQYSSYPRRFSRSGVATVLLVSDLEAEGGRDADLAYLRVADDIAARIASGELAPGARLRSERDLAAHYGVSYGTIRRAMEVLRDRSLIDHDPRARDLRRQDVTAVQAAPASREAGGGALSRGYWRRRRIGR